MTDNKYLFGQMARKIEATIDDNILDAYECVTRRAYNYESYNGTLKNVDEYRIKEIINGYFKSIHTSLIDDINDYINVSINTISKAADKPGVGATVIEDVSQYVDSQCKRAISKLLDKVDSEFIYDFKDGAYSRRMEDLGMIDSYEEDLYILRRWLYDAIEDEFGESRKYIVSKVNSILQDTLDEYLANMNIDVKAQRDEEIEKFYDERKKSNQLVYDEYKDIIESDEDLLANFNALMEFMDELARQKVPYDSWTNSQYYYHDRLSSKIVNTIIKATKKHQAKEAMKQPEPIVETVEPIQEQAVTPTVEPIQEQTTLANGSSSRSFALREVQEQIQQIESSKHFTPQQKLVLVEEIKRQYGLDGASPETSITR